MSTNKAGNVQAGYWIENGVLWFSRDTAGDSKHKIPEADLATLQILNQTWAKDNKKVWALGDKVRKAYAPAFQALNASFGRDDECLFDSLGRIVKDINPAAFEVLDKGFVQLDHPGDQKIAGYARCQGKIYHYEHFDHKTMWLRGADAESFEVLKWGLARDQSKVFKGQYVLKAKPQTFRQLTSLYSEDGQNSPKDNCGGGCKSRKAVNVMRVFLRFSVSRVNSQGTVQRFLRSATAS